MRKGSCGRPIVPMLVALWGASSACTAPTIPTSPSVEPVACEASPSLCALGWLTGRWVSRQGDAVTEERWSRPLGDSMIGTSRTVEGGRITHYELMLLQDRGGVELLAMPKGQPPARFPMVARSSEGERAWVRFENPAHDFPKRIAYRRVGDDLEAAIGGVETGPTTTWRFHRVAE